MILPPRPLPPPSTALCLHLTYQQGECTVLRAFYSTTPPPRPPPPPLHRPLSAPNIPARGVHCIEGLLLHYPTPSPPPPPPPSTALCLHLTYQQGECTVLRAFYSTTPPPRPPPPLHRPLSAPNIPARGVHCIEGLLLHYPTPSPPPPSTALCLHLTYQQGECTVLRAFYSTTPPPRPPPPLHRPLSAPNIPARGVHCIEGLLLNCSHIQD